MRNPVTLFFCFLPQFLCAQIYDSDSATIVINSKDHFIVNKYEDLNIKVDCLAKSKEGVEFYSTLKSRYRSTFGNCFFELYKLDSSISFKNITSDVMSANHTPIDVKNEKDILTYDCEKTHLRLGEMRTLVFNVLDYVSSLPIGKYSMIVYLRSVNNYGYNKLGIIVTNSICYLESIPINFEVTAEVKKDIPLDN